MSLQSTDAESAAVATAPRVALKDIEDKISARYDLNGGDLIDNMDMPVHDALMVLSICILVMQNGFTIIGKSAPAAAANFNTDLGCKLAYEDAIRQAWPLEGYALRERLMQQSSYLATGTR